MRTRRLAIGLAAALVALAAVAAWYAAILEQPPSRTTDPHHHDLYVAGVFAAGFCLYALSRLREVSRGRARWAGASLWFVLAVIALLVVDAVAALSRLGVGP
jgi:peptidoglycan/LPS O-acetylase OafA/YrhL